MANWNEIGKRALNICLKTYRKSEDYEEALESFDEELVDNMEETGIEFEDGWEFDLSISQISDLISGIVSQSKESDDSDLIGSIHTHIVDKLNETIEKHGEEHLSNWIKSLDEMLNE